MKRINKHIIILFTLVLFAMTGTQTVSAHPPAGTPSVTVATPTAEDIPAYATLVRKVPHIGASIKTARQMRNSDDHHYEQFEVIICGKVVKQLTHNPEVADFIEQGKQLGIRFSACGMSMKKFGVEEQSLLEGVNVVPNGIIHMFDLQEKGFKAIEL